ncbi:glucosaminidase domain-containing protein [Clostridium estertheticum]|uniref:glucosaminidase domain-containing protein n=1 Tax=Clostridium estertheticum TaxID=238834 RepID=UPI0013E98457|nr:glucosaminidase domain-containing protein [Clostridium estertheticum]MBZ9684889.1 glucosaminidase domain-containing protein [Clostridium estertheticum]
MSMKNNLTNWKLLLFTIIYSVVCIVFIKNYTGCSPTTFKDFEKENSKIIVILPTYETTLSNKFPYATAIPPKDKKSPTLSRGYIEPLYKNSSKNMESYNYEDDLYALNESDLLESYYAKKASIISINIIPKENPVVNAHLPDYLMYKNVNITNLKEFLKSKNSLLVEEPYFSTILSVSKDFNLNPLVMFAIAGQEQSFVPKDDENAYKIANNPFNVFYSWKRYNTSIQDSASIAARTLVNLCKNKPTNTDAFTWVNRKYSEDKNWSKAVRSIFNQLQDNVSYWK